MTIEYRRIQEDITRYEKQPVHLCLLYLKLFLFFVSNDLHLVFRTYRRIIFDGYLRYHFIKLISYLGVYNKDLIEEEYTISWYFMCGIFDDTDFLQ